MHYEEEGYEISDETMVMVDVLCETCQEIIQQIQYRNQRKDTIPKCPSCLHAIHTSTIINPLTGKGFMK